VTNFDIGAIIWLIDKDHDAMFNVLITSRVGVHGERCRELVAVPIYIARVLCLSLQRDCLTRSSNTRAFSELYLYVFITLSVNTG